MYIAGQLKELHPTLFEAICLVEGLGRLGFKEEAGADVRVQRGYTSTPEKALCKDQEMSAGDACLFVTLEAPKAETLAIVSEAGHQYAETSFEERVRWTAVIGKIPSWSEGEFATRWAHAVMVFGEAEPGESERAWEGSRARRVLDGVTEVLRHKGFAVKER